MLEILPTLVFYLFAGLTLISGAMVVASRNPVHSVLFLILSFFSAAALFLLIGAEYLAMTLVIVYVGAVAVLFLFVVMMLDINFTEMRQGFLRYLPLGLTVAAVLLLEIGLAMYVALARPEAEALEQTPEQLAETALAQASNTHALGLVLYTEYVYAFQVAGLILLVAMIGAITLTLRHRPGVRRQRVAAQMARKREDAMQVVQVKPGQGTELPF